MVSKRFLRPGFRILLLELFEETAQVVEVVDVDVVWFVSVPLKFQTNCNVVDSNCQHS